MGRVKRRRRAPPRRRRRRGRRRGQKGSGVFSGLDLAKLIFLGPAKAVSGMSKTITGST